jgi:tRNA threonylcarbamoyladenosine biosynthesis protein TsaE
MNVLREWKKVAESDLDSLIFELREFLTEPAFIILTGDVGVGKTTFTKSFAKLLVNEPFTLSPTYSVVNELGTLVHADFYRLKTADDIVHLELDIYLEDKEYFLVEWGRQFHRELLDFVPREFSHYELLFEMNKSRIDGQEPTRNLRLIKLLED